MGNINPLSVEYFESYANEIEGKFQRVKLLIKNKSASGDYHEEVLRTILRNFLSKRYSIKKGFIYKDKHNVSNQVDILIIDESSPAAYIFQEGDFAIVIPEAVVAVMEVKTTLQAGDFDKAIENIASAKKLIRFPANLTGIIFGYQGTKPSDKNLHSWFTRIVARKYENKKVLGPDGIMFFTDGYLLTTHDENGKWIKGGDYYHKVFRDESVKASISDVGWQISIILAMIVNACERMDFVISRRFKNGSQANRLIQSEGSMISHSRFSLGKGLSTLRKKMQETITAECKKRASSM